MSRKEVLEQLKAAAMAYYNGDDPIMTDDDYDVLMLYAESQGWVNTDNQLNDGVKIGNTDIKHDIPMLSLAKAKSETDVEKYFDYIRKFSSSTFVVEPKIDGLALSVKYSNGSVKLLSTRGNGLKGENVTYLLDSSVEIENLFRSIPETGNVELRGELYCTSEMLIENNRNRGESFKNERIAVAGIVKKAKLGLGYSAKLKFTPYFEFRDNVEVSVLRCYNPARDMFEQNASSTKQQLLDVIHKANEWRKNCGAPTDGVVIKPSNIIKTESATDHHPKEFIAYKYPGETKVSVVEGVKWGVGKTGKLTPVATIDPVEIDNVLITNITLHNISWIREMGIKRGSVVEVTRANDVIPAITRVVSNSDTTQMIEHPKHCPDCNSETEVLGRFVFCRNYNCPSKVKSKLMSFVGRALLDIEGLNDALLEVLDCTSVVDLMALNFETLKNRKFKSGVSLGEARATQIDNQIKNAAGNTPQEIWLSTLEIPGVAKQTAKLLLDTFGSIDNFLVKATFFNLSNIKGVGQETATSIAGNLERATDIWNNLKPLINIVPYNVTSDDGETFCVTGKVPENFKNRDELVKHLAGLGYVFHSSIKGNTKYLITDDPNSNSSKAKKARANGVQLLTYDELMNKGD